MWTPTVLCIFDGCPRLPFVKKPHGEHGIKLSYAWIKIALKNLDKKMWTPIIETVDTQSAGINRQENCGPPFLASLVSVQILQILVWLRCTERCV
jgi:hypothetical protein